MTEEEWLACDDPVAIAGFLWVPEFDRRLRLFACACCRSVWETIPAPGCRTSVEVAERFADGSATDKERRLATVAAHRSKPSWLDAHWVAADCTGRVAYHAADRAIRRIPLRRPVLVALLREIFGNPFRRVAVDPAWLTSDVLALARGIYDERAFDRTPILADALQDAGCDGDELLNHLRDPKAVHVRGCWALDLVLGKA